LSYACAQPRAQGSGLSRARPDRPDELGKDQYLEPELLGAVEEIALRPFGWPGDQRDIVVIVMVQALDRQKRILLGAADDEPGDDVDDPHFSEVSQTWMRRAVVARQRSKC